MEYLSKNEAETSLLAHSLAGTIKPGDILALNGDLGSGKTTFTKALAAHLGVAKTVTSPTFVIMKEYDISEGSITKLIHVDCYRLQSQQDLESIGLLEIFERDDVVTVLEWPQNIKEFLPVRVKSLSF